MKISRELTMNIKEATNKAKYVEWLDDYTFAVWKGGHTVNFYSMGYENPRDVTPTNCIIVGSFGNNNATLEEVKEGIKSHRG